MHPKYPYEENKFLCEKFFKTESDVVLVLQTSGNFIEKKLADGEKILFKRACLAAMTEHVKLRKVIKKDT